MNKIQFRFLGWIILFFSLLISVSLLITKDQIFVAKVLGVVLIVSISTALWIWRIQTLRKKQINSKVKLNINDVFWLERNIPFFNSLNKTDRKTFLDLSGLFLANVPVISTSGNSLEKKDYLIVSSYVVEKFWYFPTFDYTIIRQLDLDSDWKNQLERNISIYFKSNENELANPENKNFDFYMALKTNSGSNPDTFKKEFPLLAANFS